jgi:hypothetical protein
MVVLTDNHYFSLVYFPEISVVRYTRTEHPYPSNEELERLHMEVGPMLDRIGRQQYCLLVDMRSAPINNTPGFEQAMARARVHLLRGFTRISVLVRTAVGALQARRYGREDAINVHVFQDEGAAISFLRSLTVEASTPTSSATGSSNEWAPASSQRTRRWGTG